MSIKSFVLNLIGSPEEFSMENRTYNTVNLMVFPLLFFFFLLSTYTKNHDLILLIVVVAVIQVAFYYLSRYKKQFRIGIIGNGIMSYIALSINYFYDAGSYGPTLFISFLTFQLLIAVTTRKQHMLWIVLHIIFAGTLIAVEYQRPGLIKTPYINMKMRDLDLSISYIGTLTFIYFVTYFLGKNYNNERKISIQRAKTIESQKANAVLSETKLRAFFNSSAADHILIGKNKEVLDYNNAAVQSIKAKTNKIIAINDYVVDYVCPSYQEKFTKHYYSAINGQTVYDEFKEENENAENKWWAFSFETARDNDGNISGITFNATDISERKLQEEKIKARNEALTKIAFIQSHELRGPVTTIYGLMNIIKDENYEHPREYLEMMEIAVKELDRKIHEVIRQTEKMS